MTGEEADEFNEIGNLVRTLGFRLVASGPFVRSSYHAGEMAAGLERASFARPLQKNPNDE